MAFLPTIELIDSDKLDVLQRLDHFRKWRSLDEKRFCRCCKQTITGRSIQVIGGSRGMGPLRIICATQSCHATPFDWVPVPPQKPFLARAHQHRNGDSNGSNGSANGANARDKNGSRIREYNYGTTWVFRPS